MGRRQVPAPASDVDPIGIAKPESPEQSSKRLMPNRSHNSTRLASATIAFSGDIDNRR